MGMDVHDPLSSKGAGAVSLGHVLNENLAYSSSERCSLEWRGTTCICPCCPAVTSGKAVRGGVSTHSRTERKLRALTAEPRLVRTRRGWRARRRRAARPRGVQRGPAGGARGRRAGRRGRGRRECERESERGRPEVVSLPPQLRAPRRAVSARAAQAAAARRRGASAGRGVEGASGFSG